MNKQRWINAWFAGRKTSNNIDVATVHDLCLFIDKCLKDKYLLRICIMLQKPTT